jgi:hypothetical protein
LSAVGGRFRGSPHDEIRASTVPFCCSVAGFLLDDKVWNRLISDCVNPRTEAPDNFKLSVAFPKGRNVAPNGCRRIPFDPLPFLRKAVGIYEYDLPYPAHGHRILDICKRLVEVVVHPVPGRCYRRGLYAADGLHLSIQGEVSDIETGGGPRLKTSRMPSLFDHLDGKARFFAAIPAFAGALILILEKAGLLNK